ncbi:MAG: tetratricopeptide repeat protein [Candidatus Poribacteria bacterium]|nr:tetratricopeptide repeat protein [Candidatus Poribacteria bacterium]
MEVAHSPQHFMFTKLACAVLILTTALSLIPSISKTETAMSEMQQGMEYVKLRLYPQAVDTFNSILSRNPTDISAIFQLANVYKLQDELELAIKTFDKIFIIADTKNIPINDRVHGFTHLALSEIYCKQSKLDIAEQQAMEAVQRCPTNADMYYRLGYIYTHQAKFDKALTALKRTLSLKPDFAEVYEWLGLIALMQHKPEEAITHYKVAINKKPYVQSAYYNLAKAYRLIGDMESATEQLKLFQQMKTYYDKTYAIEGTLAEDPSNAALRLKLAEIHVAHKNISAAVATYQALIRLNPEFIAGYDKLGRLYMELNMPQRAIPLFHKVIKLNPNAVEAHVRLGWLYTTQKAFGKAEIHLQKTIEKMPKLTLAYHGLAEIYIQQGHIEKAINTYQHITQIEPDDKDAWAALQNLERLKKGEQTKR